MSSNNVDNDDLDSVSGGRLCNMKNPVAGLSKEEAEKIAKSLGNGKSMYSWKTQSALDYMKWWAYSNNKSLSEEDMQRYSSEDWFKS